MISVNGHPIVHDEVAVKVWGETGPYTFRVGDQVGTTQIVVHDTGVAVYFHDGTIEFFPFHNVIHVTAYEDMV